MERDANALSKWNVTIAQSETSLTVTVADLPYGTSLGDLNELFRTEENYSQITVDGALYLFVWTAAPDNTLGAGNAEYKGGWTNKNVVKTVTVSVDGEAPYEKTYYVTEKDGSYTFDLGTLATPEKLGYVFDVWEVTGGTLAGNTLTITSDSAQVAPTWKQITYTVTYGGEEVSLDKLVFIWDGSQFTRKEGDVAELADVTRVGYTFAGWKYGELTVKTLEALFAGSELGNAGGTEVNVTIGLAAVWAANEYTVTFAGGDGATGAMNDQIFVFGKEGTLDQNSFVFVGYDFGGWTWKGQSYGGTFTVTADNLPESGTVITLTAVWTEKTYTIVYEEKGGESVSDAENVAFLENVTLPTATRTGYAFLGWATSDDGNVVYAGGAQVPVNLLFTGLEGTGAREKTLYAVWTEKRYTVVYDEKDGEPVSDATDVAFSASVTLPTATRTGYAFLGWATSDGGNVVYAGGAQVPVDLLFTGLEAQGARERTLYATQRVRKARREAGRSSRSPLNTVRTSIRSSSISSNST